MTPSEYVKRFARLCKEQSQSLKHVWQELTTEDHQALISGSQAEWDCLALCLKLWQRQHMAWQVANDIELPEIDCITCTSYTKSSVWCGHYNKAIPTNYDTSKACKEWNY